MLLTSTGLELGMMLTYNGQERLPYEQKYYLAQNVNSIKVERLYFMEFIKENDHVSLLS